MSDLTRTTLAIDAELLAKFDAWMTGHGYTNRSEAVRDLLRAALTEEQWRRPRANVVGVLSFIYDHASRDLAQEVTETQHKDPGVILCSQHVHLDRHSCLEVVLMRGKSRQLRGMADSLISTRGIKAGKLTMLSPNV